MNNLFQYGKYFGSVEFSAEDGLFYGKVIGIDDLVSFEGKSVKELKASFRESVDDYLETCKTLGKNPEKLYKGSFNIRINPETHREASLFSASLKMSLNDFVGKAVELALKHPKEISPTR